MPVCKRCGQKHNLFRHALGTGLCSRCHKITTLRTKLDDINIVVRIKAAGEIFKLGDDTVYQILIDALEHEEACLSAAMALEERGCFDEVVPKLKKTLLTIKNTWVLLGIVKLLRMSNSPDVTDILKFLLSNRKPSEFSLVTSDPSGLSMLTFGVDGERIFTEAREEIAKRELSLKKDWRTFVNNGN